MIEEDMVDFLLLGVLIDNSKGRKEFDNVESKIGKIDKIGEWKKVLKLVDEKLIEDMGLIGGVILGVLRKIKMGERLGDWINDKREIWLMKKEKILIEILKKERGNREILNKK